MVISNGNSGATGFVVLKNFFSQTGFLDLQLPNYVPPNSAPLVGITLIPHKLLAGNLFTYIVGSDTFFDFDQGDVLILSAAPVNGSQLPDWLSFDPKTRAFTGTPPAGSAQNIDITLTATDSAGASVAQTLTFVIEEPTLPAGQNITGTSGNDVLIGAAGNDVIVGLDGNDTLDGGDGDDKLDGGTGNDILKGWRGNNTYLFGKGDGNDCIDIDRGRTPRLNDFNILQFKDGVRPDEIIVTRERDDLVLSIADSSDSIRVKDLLYWVEVAAKTFSFINEFRFSDGTSWDLNTVRLMEAANHSIDGGNVLYGYYTDDALHGGSGNDNFDAGGGNDILAGGGGDDRMYGGYGNDIILGQTGDDWIWGEDGDDVMYGGEGNDNLKDVKGKNIFDGGSGNDFLEGGGEDKDIFMFGKEDGTDTITYGAKRLSEVHFKSGVAPEEVIVTRSRSDFVLSISGTNDNITLKFFLNDVDPSSNVSPVQQVKFFDGTVWDLATLESKAGSYIYQAPVFLEMEPLNLLNGENLSWYIGGYVSDEDGSGMEYSATLENGDELPSWLSLDDGYLTGSVSVGASGSEIIRVRITATDNDGLSSSEIIVLNLSTPGVILRGTANADILNGLQYNDQLYGRGGNDKLFGNAGSDKLYGESGNDVLDGGTGDDELYGGSGNDIYIVDSTGDVVVELINEGTDLVQSAVTYTLVANVENLTLTGEDAINGAGNTSDNTLIGNSSSNTLTGDAGNDVLNGGAGADTMLGGAGDDTYVVDTTGDVVTELTDEGTDLVQSAVTYTLTANVENLMLTGTSAINGTGNALNNTLTGNTGANILDGGAGADTMVGGTGNDTYYVDNTGDITTEAASAGTDTVISSVNWTLATNLENLTLSGTANINATGNTLVNVLTGNAGDNILDGGTGTDTMIGGLGNDTYVLDVATDIVTEGLNAGIDTVQSKVTYTLGANVENLTLTGTTAINGTGNALDNVLTGNSAANVLTGGAGNDTYVVGTGDTTIEAANAGIDTVQSAIAWTLVTNVENLTLTGSSAVNGTGNTADNVLLGNSGANTLTGNAGNDTLNGGAGADILVGGTGNDTYWLGRGFGFDSVTENDTTSGNTDVARFDTGIATDQLWFVKTGNNLDVSIIGTTDKLTMTNWYLGSQYHVEQFKTSDGKTLLDSQVQNLVSAMAAFSPPAAGQTTLSASYAASLNPVIAANWQ